MGSDKLIPSDTPKLLPHLPEEIVPRHAWSWESLCRARRWLDQCLTTHSPTCTPSAAVPLPTRLLDVSTSTVRLVETTPGQLGRYLALSHCWGASRPACLTTRASLSSNLSGIPWSSLPATFRDAVQVARVLETQYLWIDSLCIVQDDVADWRREAARMADVYARAHLTLAATWAPSDDAGLWPRGPLQNATAEKVVVERDGARYAVFVRDADAVAAVHLARPHVRWVWERYESTCPLLTRAWCFQERILSPRVLHFAKGELLWQCAGLSACECRFRRRPTRSSPHMGLAIADPGLATNWFHVLAKSGPEEVARQWRMMVAGYSQLRLTMEKDVLPAMSGLARVYGGYRPAGDRYLAGCWEKTLVDDLAWEVRPDLPLRERPKEWRAPTWSWASVGQAVIYDEQSREYSSIGSTTARARLVRADITLAGDDPTGEIEAASIVLQAPVVGGTILEMHPDSNTFQLEMPELDDTARALNKVRTKGAVAIQCLADSRTDIESRILEESSPVTCMLLKEAKRDGGKGMHIILVLAPVSDRPGVYTRIGQGLVMPWMRVGSLWDAGDSIIEII
ncbi:heterokaryon incompatibility protein-domain-containing protein [Echria macrotheca]|uniref:Heterokaryon incompatibility protein-domain-containing protein n=1 Tax=Echria macrotheca TaxID=438768 RepID=A0AAJ0B5B5_9PEZI|nr:heterokaryon incompatibility protein-domain-containing protein [Echria macrotheca]